MKKRIYLSTQLFASNQTITATFGKRLNETNAHKYFDMTLKDAIYDEYNFEKYFDTITLPKNNGKTYSFRRRGKYVLRDNADVAINEGQIPDEDTPMTTYNYQLSLNTFGGFITFSDQVDLYSIDKGESTALQRNQGYAVGEMFQEKAYSILKATTNQWIAGATSITSSSTLASLRENATALDLDEFRKIKTFFQRNKVKPYDTDYLVVISPEVAETLLSLTKNSSKFTFIEIANYQQNTKPLYDGEIGRWNGFRFVVDPAIKAVNSDNPTVHACLILGKYQGEKGAKILKLEGYGKPESIIKHLGSAGTNDPLNQKGSLAWKCEGWGGAVVYPEAVMLYNCLASAVNEDVFDDTNRPTSNGGYDADGDAITATPITVANGTEISNE